MLYYLIAIMQNNMCAFQKAYCENNIEKLKKLLNDNNTIINPYYIKPLHYTSIHIESLYDNNELNCVISEHLGKYIFFSGNNYVAINLPLIEEYNSTFKTGVQNNTLFENYYYTFNGTIFDDILIISSNCQNREKFYKDYKKYLHNNKIVQRC